MTTLNIGTTSETGRMSDWGNSIKIDAHERKIEALERKISSLESQLYDANTKSERVRDQLDIYIEKVGTLEALQQAWIADTNKALGLVESKHRQLRRDMWLLAILLAAIVFFPNLLFRSA